MGRVQKDMRIQQRKGNSKKKSDGNFRTEGCNI